MDPWSLCPIVNVTRPSSAASLVTGVKVESVEELDTGGSNLEIVE